MAIDPRQRIEAMATVHECCIRGLYEEAREILVTLGLEHKAQVLPARNERVGLQFGYL